MSEHLHGMPENKPLKKCAMNPNTSLQPASDIEEIEVFFVYDSATDYDSAQVSVSIY